MKIIDNIKEGIRSRMKNFLQIDSATDSQIVIQENMSEESRIAKNTIWYRGNANELIQLHQQLPNKTDTFWGAIGTAGLEIRKIHTGLPALIIDTLTDITMSDYNGIDFNTQDKNVTETWEEIEKENKFNDLLSDSVTSALYKGCGAFKISFDETISQLPILEYFGKDEIEIIKKRKRIREIIFRSYFVENSKKYLLKEIYGFGYIIYKVYNEKEDKEYSIKSFKHTSDLEDILFDGAEIDINGNIVKYGTYMLAVPLKIKEHAIYDKKTDNFDAFDETWSQWMNALRDGRSRTYIPESLLPRNPKTGELMKPNSFDNKFIKIEASGKEKDQNTIETKQPEIPTDPYIASYINALDICLQGIISPTTLGIDNKKLTDPNAAFQREKEKTTLWTRGKIIEAVQEAVKSLVDVCFKGIATLNKKELIKIECDVKFGEYANPSFEAQVETVGKAKTNGIMSLETCVDELYGDSKEETWKADEVARLKAEQGIIGMEEPAVNFDVEMSTNKDDINKNNSDVQEKDSKIPNNAEEK